MTYCPTTAHLFSLIFIGQTRGLGGCAVHLHSAGQCTIFKFSVTNQDWHCFSPVLHLFVPPTSTNLLLVSPLVIHHHLHHHHHQNRSQRTVHLPMSIKILKIFKCKKLLHAHLKTIDSFFKGSKIFALCSFSIFVIYSFAVISNPIMLWKWKWANILYKYSK